MTRVLMVTPEAQPYAKTGGLGDVLAALPSALRGVDVDVSVCLPAYRRAVAVAGALEPIAHVLAPVSSRMVPADLLRIRDAVVPTYLVRADRYFDREEIYGTIGGGYDDNAERFVFFCRAVLEWLR